HLPPPDTPNTSPLSLHDALPILQSLDHPNNPNHSNYKQAARSITAKPATLPDTTEDHAYVTSGDDQLGQATYHSVLNQQDWDKLDRKSTRLNSSHVKISYAVFCL